MTKQSKLEKALLASIEAFNERAQRRGNSIVRVVFGAHAQVGDDFEDILDQRGALIQYAGRDYQALCYPMPENGVVGRCKLSIEFPEWELPLEPQALYNVIESLDSNVQLLLHPYENGPLKRLMVAGVQTEIPLSDGSADWLEFAFSTLSMAAGAIRGATTGNVHDHWSQLFQMEEEFDADDEDATPQ